MTERADPGSNDATGTDADEGDAAGRAGDHLTRCRSGRQVSNLRIRRSALHDAHPDDEAWAGRHCYALADDRNLGSGRADVAARVRRGRPHRSRRAYGRVYHLRSRAPAPPMMACRALMRGLRLRSGMDRVPAAWRAFPDVTG